MSKGDPDKEAFDKLLSWLDSDRDRAAQKYETIRFRLIRIFASRGCGDGEHLADQTFNVVTSQIDWLIENYEGDPALYFYGVAKKILQEQNKKKPPPQLPPPPDVTEAEHECGCLEKCLKQELLEPDRRLVLRYHEKEKKEKIILRRQLAEELAITINALRIRVHHINTRLRTCIEDCLKDLPDR